MMNIRDFVQEDLPHLVNLLNKTYGKSYEFIPYTEDKLRSWIQEGNLKVLVAEEDGEVTGSIACRSGHWGEEIELLTTYEIPNQKLTEDALVGEIEKHLKGEKIFTVVDSGSPKINEWTERGYKLEGGLYHMIAILEGPKSLPKVPEGIIIRSLKPKEEKEFVEAVNAGFGSERLKIGVIQRWKKECPPFNEEWVHVAEIDNKIVSVVASRPDVEYNEFFGGKRGYLGPAATLSEHRSKNLASALACRAMNFLFQKGLDSVALYTSEQNIPSITLLRKLGFKIGHHWVFMRKQLSQPQ